MFWEAFSDIHPFYHVTRPVFSNIKRGKLDMNYSHDKINIANSNCINRRHIMNEHHCGLRVGQTVPDFKVETYEPMRGGFGERSLAEMKDAGKWTILFFYPADFTFV